MDKANGKKTFNFGIGPRKGTASNAEKKQEFESRKEGLKANCKAVANMYNGNPLNLSSNRQGNVKNGKPSRAKDNKYTDRLMGTL